MAHEDITQQTLIEQGMLGQIMEVLRQTVGWREEGGDSSRKLSTLRFIAQSFQRHLERLMALEEYDGYMGLVRETSPHLARAVDGLQQEHGRFREAARRVVQRLERVPPTDRAAVTDVCDELLALLHRLDEHGLKEVDLLQEAFDRDGGGEG
jgi:hemerythrin-like domain-containing protein